MKRQAAAAPKRRDSELTTWLAADDAVFAERLLGETSGETSRQIESWKLVGQLWAHEPWQPHLRAAGAESTPPSPRSFAGVPLTPLVHALLGLCGRDALAWCVYAYLTRTGSAATAIAEAIVAHALPV